MDLKENAQKNKEFFNRKIDEYDQTHEQFMNTKKSLTDNMPDNVKNVLDLGAGTGLELIELFNKYPNLKVKAIDISEKMLEKLNERPFASKVETICGNFFEVEFGENYDAVISTSSLHHFVKSDKYVLYKKIYDSLKDGGIFLNSDKIVLTNDLELEQLKFYEENKDIKPHIDTPLSIEHEIELLEKIGFKNIEVCVVDKEDYRLFKAIK